MRAVITPEYGPPEVMRLVDAPKPIPGKNEVSIRVCATQVSSGDCRARSFHVPWHVWIPARIFLGIIRPRAPIQGLWLAGEVEAVGEGVTRFKAKDRVYGNTISAGMRFGAYAEYACLPEAALMAQIPPSLTYEEAVAIPFGGLTALHFLRKAGAGEGHHVLIHGASGAVGSSAAQVAVALGARVTGVCSGANVELVKSLGAEHAVDYTRENFADGRTRYDIVFDAAGKTTRRQSAPALKPGGKYVSVVTSGHVAMKIEDLNFLGRLAEERKIKAVIDRVYPLERMVEAHRYVELGHKKGNVVITMGGTAAG